MSTGTVVVTGASSGIGAATADLLTRNSWTVIGVDLTPPITKGVHSVVGDVSDRSVLRRARAAGEAHGPLVGWVNCAGIPFTSNLLDVDPELVQKVVAVNQLAYFWGCVEAATSFIENGHKGSIVNISSIHGVRGFHGWSAYDMCKGAVDALTRSIAVEFASAGIRCNAVSPGSVETPLVQQLESRSRDAMSVRDEAAAISPMGRAANPGEIAETVFWLLSSATFITGQVIAVDGGATAWIPTIGRGYDGR